MNNLDKSYQALLQDILDIGVKKEDRTGTGTISVFGRQIRHKMSEGFPLITSKKMYFKGIVTELLWFLRGDTNIKYLVDNDCHIWDGDAYKNYVKHNQFNSNPKWIKPIPLENGDNGAVLYSIEEFINKIKEDDEFAKEWGELGPIYGKQWRKWSPESGENNKGGVDQIQNLINDLKTNPDSRRLMVNAWNVGELDQMVLPPCHYGFQVYTRELSLEERVEMIRPFGMDALIPEAREKWMEENSIPKRAISLMWNQRSVDTFLGLPFNIASYGLLLEIIAKEVNMVPDELIGNLGDVHLYSNHIDAAKEQIGRKLTFDERYALYTGHDKTWEEDGGNSYGKINGLDMMDDKGIPIRTREPFPLPSVKITHREWYQHQKVKENLGEKTFNEKILALRPDCFELIDYQSHPSIKAKLSN
jgi:thymidylate synthase